MTASDGAGPDGDRDELAGGVLLELTELAVVVRDDGPAAIARQVDRVLAAAGGDTHAALVIAAALIPTDASIVAWWQRPRTAAAAVPVIVQPCGTRAAAARHRRHGEPLDVECVAAERAHHRAADRGRAAQRRTA